MVEFRTNLVLFNHSGLQYRFITLITTDDLQLTTPQGMEQIKL